MASRCQVCILLVCYLINPAVFAEKITRDSLGRSIYESGMGRDGRTVSARLSGNITLSGAAIACINCHGKDGRGGEEAFVRAPDIRWFSLGKPYTGRRSGTAGATYDRASFARVMRLGIAPDGRRLDPVMPRTDLADDEIDALIDYLASIDEKASEASPLPVILGLLPRSGLNLLADTLDRQLADCPTTNRNRPVAAIDVLYFSDPNDAIRQLDAKLTHHPDAWILAPYLIGWEDEYVQAMKHKPAITILPVTQLDPPDGSRWLFPFPGLKAQILALLQSAWEDGYTHLQIEHQTDSTLSITLSDFARQVAEEIGFMTGKISERSAAVAQKSARLWLRPIDRNEVGSTYQQHEAMLAPGIFFTHQPVNVGHGQYKSFHWLLAYPYTLQLGDNTYWLTPAEAWAAAACEFLVRAADGSINRHNLADYSLENWSLAAHPALKQSAAQVYLHRLTKDH